jgi:hypothetical protein
MFIRNLFVAAALSVVAAVGASAQNSIAVQSGVTSITLSPTLAATLQNLGVTLTTVSPSVDTNGVVNLPITGGAFDLATAKGEIFHTGGLTFTKGNIVITITDFLIDTTDDSLPGITAPIVSALVISNRAVSGRLPLFNLGKPTGFQLPLTLTDKVILTLNGSALTLNATAAAELNTTFGVSTLYGGLPIGTVNTAAVVGSAL